MCFLQKQLADFEAHRAAKSKTIEDNIALWKKKLSKASKKSKGAEDSMESLNIEVSTLANDRSLLLEQIDVLTSEIAGTETAAEEQRITSAEQKEKYLEVKVSYLWSPVWHWLGISTRIQKF